MVPVAETVFVIPAPHCVRDKLQREYIQPRINLLFQPQLLVKQLARWNSEIFQGNRTILT